MLNARKSIRMENELQVMELNIAIYDDEEIIREQIKELAGQFYRIHRGYLINLFHVEGYDKTEVRMANGDKLLLSRYKYDGFVQAYMDYISEESL